IENVVYWTLLGKVAAGAFSDNDLENLDDRKKSEVTVLAESDAMPRHLVSVRRDLEHAVVSRLKEILLGMHEDKDGQKILKEIDRTTKFDLLPGGEEMMYRKIRDLFRLSQTK